MSTILETLKKLEEDKRSMEKELDLKELVLREDQKLQVTAKVSRKNFLVTGLVLIIIILVVLIFFKRAPNENHKIYLPLLPSEAAHSSLRSNTPCTMASVLMVSAASSTGL